MNLPKFAAARRRVLFAPLVGGLGWLAGSLIKSAAAQEKATLIAKRVDRVPDAPDDPLWGQADALAVPMAPQAVVKPRTYEAGVKTIRVACLYDDERIAFAVAWDDATRDAAIGGVESFRDAVALEFPAEPVNGIPYFGMGEPNKPVTIYQWKADWEFSSDRDVDEMHPNMAVDWYPYSGRNAGEIAGAADYGKDGAEKVFHTSWWAGSALGDIDLQAKTTVEKLQAEGFGTLTSVDAERQDGSGQAVWNDGKWTAVITIPRTQDAFAFEAGKIVPVAFAAWNGARGERGGEKAVSTWYFLSLEQPVGPMAYFGPLAAFVGVAAVQAWGLSYLRRRARHAGEIQPDSSARQPDGAIDEQGL